MGNKNTKDIDAFRSKTTNSGSVNDNDNIAPGDRGQYLHPDIKRKIMEAQKEYNEEQEKKKNKKNRKK